MTMQCARTTKRVAVDGAAAGGTSQTVRLVAIVGVVACSRGAPLHSATAACGEGLLAMGGTCVTYRMADAFCGPAAKAQPGGRCLRKACARGEPLDLEHGICLPEAMAVTTLLHGAPLQADEKREPTCRSGALTSSGGRLDCSAGPRACGRGERFVKSPEHAGDAGNAGENSGICEAAPACGLGELFDPSEEMGKCVAVVRRHGDETLVDVGTWARLAIGPDGGEGTSAFCAPVRAAAVNAGVGTGRFQIRLTVPNNDVTQAGASLLARPPIVTAEVDAAEHSLEELIQILHFFGGTSLAASVSLEVACTPPTRLEPTLEPPP